MNVAGLALRATERLIGFAGSFGMACDPRLTTLLGLDHALLPLGGFPSQLPDILLLLCEQTTLTICL
jgi:hypothetical protein